MVFCGKCGTENPDDNIYCRKCGAKISTEPIPAEERVVEPAPQPPTTSDKDSESEENRKRVILLIGSIAVLALLLLGLAVAEGSNWEHDKSDNIPSTPDGTYSYNVVMTIDDTTIEGEASMEVRNDRIKSLTVNGSSIPVDGIDIPSKVNVSKKWGGLWKGDSIQSSTVYKYDGSYTYHLSDGKIVCIKTETDGYSMTMTLKGYSQIFEF